MCFSSKTHEFTFQVFSDQCENEHHRCVKSKGYVTFVNAELEKKQRNQ